jgi:glycosyltransferase involved in cell wall biosynthesis
VSVRATARRAAAPPARLVMRSLVGARARRWPPYSRLFVVGDDGGWSLDEDAKHLTAAAHRLGVATAPSSWARFAEQQAVFHTSHFAAVHPRWLGTGNRIATSWFHGRPGTPGYPAFDTAYETLRRHAGEFWGIQVTHQEMYDLMLEAGVPPDRVFRIPIGIDIEHFEFGGPAEQEDARNELGLPQEAFVVGSFHKDGDGWGEGLEPKLVKGPDVLVAALEALRRDVPELWVLLTGPARGYVRQHLDRLGIPYLHLLAGSRAELARAYLALDVYLVPSRQEGGPKAALESMATGVPLVSTRVGQAQELVVDGENGLLVHVDDHEALAAAALRVREDADLVETLRAAGRRTAVAYRYERLDDLWSAFFDGFVSRHAADGD